MKRKSICERFASKYGILPDRIKGSEVQAIYWIERSYILYSQAATENCDRLMLDASWGYVHFLLEKIHEHVASSIIQYLLGFHASGEIIARTVIESSVNVLYIMQGESRIERIVEYILSYIHQERKQNTQWKETISKEDRENQTFYLAGLSQKAQYLEGAEKILMEGLKNEPSITSCPSPNSWGNIYDRFCALGEKMGYRTIYAAASSQVHSDAEDLLNEFLIALSPATEHYGNMLSSETSNFSRMIVYQGLRYYLKAIMAYCNCFGLNAPMNEVAKGYGWISQFSTQIAANITTALE